MNTKIRSRTYIALLNEIYNETSQHLAFVSRKEYAEKDSTIPLELSYRDVNTVKHAILMFKNNVGLRKRLDDLTSNCAYFSDWNLQTSGVIPHLCETFFVRQLGALNT